MKVCSIWLCLQLYWYQGSTRHFVLAFWPPNSLEKLMNTIFGPFLAVLAAPGLLLMPNAFQTRPKVDPPKVVKENLTASEVDSKGKGGEPISDWAASFASALTSFDAKGMPNAVKGRRATERRDTWQLPRSDEKRSYVLKNVHKQKSPSAFIPCLANHRCHLVCTRSKD